MKAIERDLRSEGVPIHNSRLDVTAIYSIRFPDGRRR